MCPSGSSRPVPTARSPGANASAWSHCGSHSSSSISGGTPCSTTNTASRTVIAGARASDQSRIRIEKGSLMRGRAGSGRYNTVLPASLDRSMQSLWQDAEAAAFEGDLGARVYTSRLLGRDKSLVLHGGGNTSVMVAERDRFGDELTILYVKGSGWDL